MALLSNSSLTAPRGLNFYRKRLTYAWRLQKTGLGSAKVVNYLKHPTVLSRFQSNRSIRGTL